MPANVNPLAIHQNANSERKEGYPTHPLNVARNTVIKITGRRSSITLFTNVNSIQFRQAPWKNAGT
jgi:hypothetical protein